MISKNILIRIVLLIIAAFMMGLFVPNVMYSLKKQSSIEDQKTDNGNLDIAQDTDSNNDSLASNIVYGDVQYSDGLTPDEMVNISVYDKRNKSVVNITTEVLAYNWFFEPVPQEGGVGSGSIIDKDGYILTNNHVIANATKVYVTLWDGEKIEGKTAGIDKENDLAIVKIDPKGLQLEVIPVGNSKTLRVGQKVLAIGNPFGLDRTLTTGIISGIGRPIRSSANIVIRNMIQTDASINPGNSGGPLLNSKGEMIGVNTIIVSPTRGSVGVGFAVPSDTVQRIIPQLIKYGKVQRGWIEWNVRPLFSELVQYAKLPVSEGLLVIDTEKRGNADKAGIEGGSERNAVRYGRTTILLGGDIIIKVNGYEVASLSDYLEALEQTKPGEKIEIEYYRNKKLRTAEITLSNRPENLVIE